METERTQTLNHICRSIFKLFDKILFIFLSTICLSLPSYSDESNGIDVTQAGINKRRQEQAALEEKQRKQQAAQKKLAQQKVYAAKLAEQSKELYLKQQLIKQEQQAKKQALEEQQRQQKEAQEKNEQARKIQQEQDRLAQQELLHQQELERLAKIEQEKKDAAEKLAHEQKTQMLTPLLSKVKLVGFIDDVPVLIFPTDPNRAFLMQPGQTHDALTVTATTNNQLTVNFQQEVMLKDVDVKSRTIPTGATLIDFLQDLKTKLKNSPYYGEFDARVSFSVDKTGHPSEMTIYGEANARTIILGAANFMPPPAYANSIQVETTLDHQRKNLPQTRIVSIGIKAPNDQR